MSGQTKFKSPKKRAKEERKQKKQESDRKFYRPPHESMPDLKQMFAVVSLCGPNYNLRTAKLEPVFHRAFLTFAEAERFRQAFVKAKTQDSNGNQDGADDDQDGSKASERARAARKERLLKKQQKQQYDNVEEEDAGKNKSQDTKTTDKNKDKGHSTSITVMRMFQDWVFPVDPRRLCDGDYQFRQLSVIDDACQQLHAKSRAADQEKVEAVRRENNQTKDDQGDDGKENERSDNGAAGSHGHPNHHQETTLLDKPDPTLTAPTPDGPKPKDTLQRPIVEQEIRAKDVEYISLSDYVKEKEEREKKKKSNLNKITTSAAEANHSGGDQKQVAAATTTSAADSAPSAATSSSSSNEQYPFLTKEQLLDEKIDVKDPNADLICPPEILDSTTSEQRWVLVEVTGFIGRTQLKEPRINIRGFFPSPEKLDEYASQLMELPHDSERYRSQFIPVPVDRRINCWYTRKNVEQVKYPKKNKALQMFVDGLRKNKEEIEEKSREQMEWEKKKERLLRESRRQMEERGEAWPEEKQEESKGNKKNKGIQVIVPSATEAAGDEKQQQMLVVEDQKEPSSTSSASSLSSDLPSFLSDASSNNVSSAKVFRGSDLLAAFKANTTLFS